MFRIRQVFNTTSMLDKKALSAALRIYQQAFPHSAEYAVKIAELLQHDYEKDFEVILLIAENNKRRQFGFTLTFFFPEIGFAYLDYIATDPKRRHRGYGAALYEATRNLLKQKHCQGLFMDVPPDELSKLREPERLPINQRRLAFYEQFGARPIINTKYDCITYKANMGYWTFIVYDGLDKSKSLTRAQLRQVVKRILFVKAKMTMNDVKLQTILNSIKDDPVQLRPPQYYKKPPRSKRIQTQPLLEVVSTGDAHQIHHLREKGYVERPARVNAILTGLQSITTRQHKLKHFGMQHIHAIHNKKMVQFLKEAATQLRPGDLLYPCVYPLRRAERLPKAWDMRAGYFCIDTFTPVTANVFRAASNAVDAALTGAELLIKGSQLSYVICRPPGHHAEPKAFGGFCYFNNAAIAANYLTKHGRVALLDIDYHHGNGSQEIFYHRDDVYFMSIHGHPSQAYPYYAGFEDELGLGKGKGFNRNFPLYPMVDDDQYQQVLAKALRLIKHFDPAFIVLSLGFDIMKGDPTGTFSVTIKGMHAIAQQIAQLKRPLLIVQEGGYSIMNLRKGVESFMRGLIK